MEHYMQVLGSTPFSSPTEIKTLFRQKALKTHPDKNPTNPNANAEFRMLYEAYTALLDAAEGRRQQPEQEEYHWSPPPPPRQPRQSRREQYRPPPPPPPKRDMFKECMDSIGSSINVDFTDFMSMKIYETAKNAVYNSVMNDVKKGNGNVIGNATKYGYYECEKIGGRQYQNRCKSYVDKMVSKADRCVRNHV